MIILIIIFIIAFLWSILGFFGSNVERADYTVKNKMKGYEIREYPAHIVAQTKVKDSYKESMNEGFKILAGYIFGGNTKKENIAMTAPVVATANGDFQIISFGMPRSYTLETLPKPNDSRVEIAMVPAKKYGVIQFSFYPSETRIKKEQEKLLSALTRDGIVSSGNIAYAGYNPPWTAPWMMRHEVLVELINYTGDKFGF